MLGIQDYGLFVAAAIMLNLMPGQDTFYILGRALGHGQRIGLASALGISAGTVVHTFAAALGLSALLATTPAAFLALKLIGAAYLVYLGVRMLVTRVADVAVDTMSAADAWAAFRQGLVTNVLNPKVALFFLALMPQFIDPTSPTKLLAFLGLGFTFVATGTLWCLVLALSAARIRRYFHHTNALAGFTRASGAMLVLLGAWLALSKR